MDYLTLNAITSKDKFPIPTIDELLDEIYGTYWPSKLELHSGFHHIQLDKCGIHKMTFHTHQGHYEVLVIPFGLCNTPQLFSPS